MSPRATLLRAVIGLDGPAEPDSSTWSTWVRTASQERVIPLLYDVVERAGSRLTEAEVEQATAMQLDVAGHSVLLEQELLEVASLLEGEGIPYAVLKGIATANLDYPDPRQRQFGDIDLLVHPGDLDAAKHALELTGRPQKVALPRYHERFEHALTIGGRSNAEIDLHQRIAPRALGLRMPTDELLGSREQFHIAGQPVCALAVHDRLIHAAVHAVASRGTFRRLSSLADVLVISRPLVVSEAAAVLGRAEGWCVRPLVEAAVRLAHDEALLTLPPVWVDAMASPTQVRDRLLERAYLGDRRKLLAEEMAHLRAMEKWSDRARYLYGHVRADAGPGAGGFASRLRYLRSRIKDPMQSGPGR